MKTPLKVRNSAVTVEPLSCPPPMREEAWPDKSGAEGTCYDWRGVGRRLVNHNTHASHRC